MANTRGVIDQPWTPEQDALLHRLWLVEGKSGAVTAAHFPGRTRNSIIGRVHRLKFKREGVSGAPKASRGYPKGRASHTPRNKQQPRPSFMAPSWRIEGGPVAPTHVALESVAGSPDRKPWLERAFGECAFPIEGEGRDTLSCCNPCGQQNYCWEHYVLTHQLGSGTRPPGAVKDTAVAPVVQDEDPRPLDEELAA